jgi:hypothetical protein
MLLCCVVSIKKKLGVAGVAKTAACCASGRERAAETQCEGTYKRPSIAISSLSLKTPR